MTAARSSRAAPALSSHRVILVREWEGQHTGSGCCGTLGGLHAEVGSATDFAHTRTLMEQMGEVYRALRGELRGQVTIEVADPRNTAWLVPAIWRDARRAGVDRREAWRAVCTGTANGAIVCDGRVLSTGRPPHPDRVLVAVLGHLARREPGSEDGHR